MSIEDAIKENTAALKALTEAISRLEIPTKVITETKLDEQVEPTVTLEIVEEAEPAEEPPQEEPEFDLKKMHNAIFTRITALCESNRKAEVVALLESFNASTVEGVDKKDLPRFKGALDLMAEPSGKEETADIEDIFG